jgi:hypothetical protein
MSRERRALFSLINILRYFEFCFHSFKIFYQHLDYALSSPNTVLHHLKNDLIRLFPNKLMKFHQEFIVMT